MKTGVIFGWFWTMLKNRQEAQCFSREYFEAGVGVESWH